MTAKRWTLVVLWALWMLTMTTVFFRIEDAPGGDPLMALCAISMAVVPLILSVVAAHLAEDLGKRPFQWGGSAFFLPFVVPLVLASLGTSWSGRRVVAAWQRALLVALGCGAAVAGVLIATGDVNTFRWAGAGIIGYVAIAISSPFPAYYFAREIGRSTVGWPLLSFSVPFVGNFLLAAMPSTIRRTPLSGDQLADIMAGYEAPDAPSRQALDPRTELLLSELVQIGRTEGFVTHAKDDPRFDENLRHIRSREIGVELHQLGGKELMQEVGSRVAAELGPAEGRGLEWAWHRVGGWIA